MGEDLNVIDFNAIIPKVLKRWYIFVAIVPAFFVISRVYLRYQTPLYQVSSALRIGTNDGGNADALLNELSPVSWSWYEILDEITVMKSYELAEKTVVQGEFNIQYFIYGEIKETELYKSAPFKVELDSVNPFVVEKGVFEIEPVNDQTYRLTVLGETLEIKDLRSDSVLGRVSSELSGVYAYGQQICIEDSTGFRVLKTKPTWETVEGTGFKFLMKTNNSVIYDMMSALKVKADFDESSIMILSMNHSNPEKAIDFLNGLMNSYKNKDYEKKLSSLVRSLDFLREQIQKVQSSLNDKELIAQKLKDDTKIYDLDAAADNTYQQILVLQESKERLTLQGNYYRLVVDYINDHRDFSDLVAPSLMGIDDPMVASIVESLKEVYVEKAQKQYSVTEDNPTYTTLNIGQEKTLDIALENLNHGIKRIEFNLRSIDEQMDEKFGLLKSLPSAELNFLRVKREIDGLNRLLEFLVEREATIGITAAKVASNHQIIDKARLSSLSPISPKKSLISLVFIALGILVSGILIFFLEFFNQKVATIAELESIYGNKVLVSLPFIKNENQIIPFDNPKSFFVETLRMLKHNLPFIVPHKTSASFVGFTSSLSGEGKTFIAANLGGVLARSGKRTLLIGADLRKPKLSNYFEGLEPIGLSEFLVGSAAMDEIIQSSNEKNFDVILSGEIPPNPADILESESLDDLFDFIRETYDYILIDCPPIGLVSDYRVLEDKLDATIFIVKQDYTTLKDLKRFQDYRLRNTHIVFNGVKKSILNKYGYSYGYGQGYYQED